MIIPAIRSARASAAWLYATLRSLSVNTRDLRQLKSEVETLDIAFQLLEVLPTTANTSQVAQPLSTCTDACNSVAAAISRSDKRCSSDGLNQMVAEYVGGGVTELSLALGAYRITFISISINAILYE